MLIAPEFARAFEGKVRRKKNITGNIRYQSVREKAKRVCGYSPEVMVRITSYGKGPGRTIANMGYISRTDKGAEDEGKEPLDLETDRGEIIRGKEVIRDFAKEWERDFGKPRKNRRDTMRLMLSMPPGTRAEAVKDATREFARKTFGGNHEYVFVLHTDEPHPHCHLVVKMLGHDGKRLDPGREDLANWRELFAQELRDQGVTAVATRRAARGVVRKPEKSVVRHIERSGRAPRVVVGRELDAIAILTAEHQGQHVEPGPWEAPIRAEQAAVRGALLAAAAALERGPAKVAFLPPDHRDRVQRAQHAAAAYQSRLAAARAGEPPRPAPNLAASAPPAGSRPLAFLPADHHKRVRRAQQAGADYQMKLSAPVKGEPPRPVTSADALPVIRPVARPFGHVTFRQPRPFPVPSLASLGKPATPSKPLPKPVFTQEIQHEQPSHTQHSAAVYQSGLAIPRAGITPQSVARLCELPGLDVARHGPAQVLLQPNARDHLGWRAGAGGSLRWAGISVDGARAGAGRESGAQGRPKAGLEGSREGNPVREGSRNSGEGAGSAITGTRSGLLTLAEIGATPASDKALAAEIRAFVAAMPAVETTRDVLKRRLAAQFSVPAAVVPQAAPGLPPPTAPQPAPSPAPDTGQQKGADRAAP